MCWSKKSPIIVWVLWHDVFINGLSLWQVGKKQIISQTTHIFGELRELQMLVYFQTSVQMLWPVYKTKESEKVIESSTIC